MIAIAAPRGVPKDLIRDKMTLVQDWCRQPRTNDDRVLRRHVVSPGVSLRRNELIIDAQGRIYVSVNLIIIVAGIIAAGNGLSLLGAKPLPEPIFNHCLLDPQKPNSVKFWIRIQWFSLKKMNLEMSAVMC